MDIISNVFGFAAAAATLTTFSRVEAKSLRIWAIAANCLFIAYGALGHHLPVLALHVILLPMNAAILVRHYGINWRWSSRRYF